MKILCLMMTLFFGCAAAVEVAEPPLEMPQSFKRYAQLIEKLYTKPGLTFGDAVKMVRPHAETMEKMIEDPGTPHLVFLQDKKHFFEAESDRLHRLRQAEKVQLRDSTEEQRYDTPIANAWFAMHGICVAYNSGSMKRGDYTILNSSLLIANIFAVQDDPTTNFFSLNMHKLIFSAYISQFLDQIATITEEYNKKVFCYAEDNNKPFLEVFDRYLRKSGTRCGNKFFVHALWILRNHIAYIDE